ncbi:hypothetical protein GIB67_020968 [Kingdonia uniflora]|uniref:Uncharacterized protein n=1 Tax=Kingdonia uniflora TaxID=39325 RepID=A0A7J7M7M8_9MAGN|nr:hypothetical protein GIB67_020968 [Kingdonia uniflora]
MVSTSCCAKADEVDLVGRLSPIIGVGDEEDNVAELVEWPRLKGSRVEYPMGCSRFMEFCKAKSSVDGIWGHAFGYRAHFDYGLTLPLSNLVKSVMNMIGACPVQLNYNFWEVILVCEALNKRWAASGSESMITAKDFLEYYSVKYVTTTDGISCKVSRKESFIDFVAKEGTEHEFARALRGVQLGLQNREALPGEVYKAEILAFSEGNYEEKEIVDEEEVEEMEDGLNIAEKTVANNQETIDQEIESLRLRVVDLEGLLEVEINSSADLQKELDVAREREEQTLLYNAEYAKEYEALISQYEDQLDDNAKLSLKLKEAKSKERAASGSQHDDELAKYRIKALNDEISNMKCNIRALNEQLLKREIDLDTVRTNLAVSEANFEKLSSSIMGKDLELRNSAQIRDILIARNVRRVVQRDKEMNEIINQLCARITELERELRTREMKYEKDLKLELDKRDGEITSGEGSREMKEFLRQKEELVENMRIDLTNSWQKSIDLTRQMSERIDQLTTELAESKAHRLKDNKRVVVTHQSFKEQVVHEQDKCDGEALHQRQLSALVAFFVEEIKFLQVERDLMQGCFFGRTCVCKLTISSIDPIGVMDRGIGATTAEKIAQGREIIAERSP